MKTSCEFRFGFWDVTARQDASFDESQNQEFADIADINIDGGISFPNVATSEPGFGWSLDGTKELLPMDASSFTWGWWSTELSSADKSFLNPPEVIINFYDDELAPTVHSSAGITLEFYATLPDVVNIKWYDIDNLLIENQDFTPISFSYFCKKQVNDYAKVVITIPSMKHPDRYLRVVGIIFGALMVLADAQVQKAVLTEELSIAALTVPINLLEFSFYTDDVDFSLLDPQGAYSLFQWKQEIKAYKTINGVRTYLGPYYLKEAEGAVDAVTQLSCVCILGILDAAEYKGGIYNEKPLEDLISEILTPEDVAFDIDVAFSGVTISGYLPICNKRYAIQNIAFAIGCIVDVTRADKVSFHSAAAAVSNAILPERKIVGHKISLEDLITQVDITAHEYSLETELKELHKATYQAGAHVVKFTGPVSATAITGATLTTAHPNYCVINVVSAGEVVISGYGYVDAPTIHTVTLDGLLPAGARGGSKSITTATLVDPSKAPTVAEMLYQYYQKRYIDEGSLIPGDEKLAVKCEIETMGGKKLTGHVERIVTDLSGGSLQSIKIRGQ